MVKILVLFIIWTHTFVSSYCYLLKNLLPLLVEWHEIAATWTGLAFFFPLICLKLSLEPVEWFFHCMLELLAKRFGFFSLFLKLWPPEVLKFKMENFRTHQYLEKGWRSLTAIIVNLVRIYFLVQGDLFVNSFNFFRYDPKNSISGLNPNNVANS